VLSEAAHNITYLRRLFQELQIEDSSPTPILCDNISSIRLVKNYKLKTLLQHLYYAITSAAYDWSRTPSCTRKPSISTFNTITSEKSLKTGQFTSRLFHLANNKRISLRNPFHHKYLYTIEIELGS
jgi:hypothetical protein